VISVPTGSGPQPERNGVAAIKNVHGTLTATNLGTYAVSYTIDNTMLTYPLFLHVGMVAGLGLQATYYKWSGTNRFATPMQTLFWPSGTNVDFSAGSVPASCTTAGGCGPSALNVNFAADPTADGFSVRWQGYVSFPSAATRTFYADKTATGAGGDSGARVWFDNKLVVDLWATATATSTSSAQTIVSGRYYDVILEFSYKKSTSTAFKYAFKIDGTTTDIITVSSLRFDVNGSPAGSVATSS
jgi:hypothetical protein